MSRYFLTLSFDGTAYHGWQIQPNAITVQETIEKGISLILKEAISLTGCGRTDTGVHASHYVAHFDHERDDLSSDTTLLFKLNSYLPEDILLHSLVRVEKDMHARFSATYREYKYYIQRTKPVFERPYRYYFYGKLDVSRMNIACSILKEYTDFTSFSKLHTDVKTNDCRIMHARWEETEDGVEFVVRADRFLRNMVRSLVGTMLEIGSGKLELDEFRKIIEARDRGLAGSSAPARGLFLTDVGY